MIIVHLVPHFGLGGDLAVVKSMSRIQVDQDHKVFVNGLDLDQAFGSRKPFNPFPLNEGFGGFFRALRNLSRLPPEAGVLHVHSPICLLFALLARIARCRMAAIVFTFHWPGPDSGLRRRIKGWLFKRCDLFHVLALDMGSMVRDRYQIRKSQLALLHVGVCPDRFLQRSPEDLRLETREKLKINSDDCVIGFLGRLSSEKNVDWLIRFMGEHRESEDLHLVIVGAGPLDDELKRRAADSGAAESIHFAGYTREPQTFYPAFDLLVLPSEFEAFPLVVVEAAYCGVPSLRSDVAGSRDQIAHRSTGFVYSQGEGYGGMKKELLRILREDRDRLPQVGGAAREHCLQLCDVEKFRAGLDRMYRDAIFNSSHAR